ncbi:histidine phosphatase super family protein [Methyloversatilis sp. RAC08]|uniref:histidine phosphatase family protein n=1 Tax=Methyloversatilis sp. RAC08 TaxID=1842540 RepID=UPI00083DAFDF|nr:histidine phosphatase family protein [Methyloversatilis sp. RAC08]AOF81485.1 histidine phosphatase super family protein [Methyloversatilis sp. RAC08]
MNRRHFTVAAGTALLAPGLARPETPGSALVALRTGGCALLMRHATTEPGIGDPPGYRLDACSSQRNLSPAGREQARRAGAWLAQQGVVFDAVFSSRWCRCVDTASLMFPGQPVEVLEALNSFFDDGSARERQTAALRSWLGTLEGSRRVALVTHQVNILALTGDNLSMGGAVVAQPDRRGGVRSVGRIDLGG